MPQIESLTLTPTARLARAESRRQAQARVAAGRSAWLSSPVLSFSAWLRQVMDDDSLLDPDPRTPISASQAQILWQTVIDRDIFIGEPRVAELAQGAWRTVHEFRLDDPADWPALRQSEDNQRFRDWVLRYRSLCERQRLIDEWAFAAELPARIQSEQIALPERIILLGFDLPLTPLQQAVVNALAAAGCSLERRPGPDTISSPLAVTAYTEPDDELRGAARWARSLLESQADRSIGIVVPDLQGRIDRVERVFRQVFDPAGFALRPSAPPAFHVSLGYPLARWPLIDQALTLLAMDPWRFSQPQAARLLGSPFLLGWDEEQAGRSRVSARLARFAPHWLDARDLMRLASREAVTLGRSVAAWQARRRDKQRAGMPSDWARRFQKELSCLGFGRGRTLDSIEYQVMQRWHELLETLGELDAVVDRPLSRARALALLSDRARGSVFRERNPGAAVEILGVEEALGSRFDATWITTLDGETWPKPARRDPLMPGEVQASVPRATGAGCLERARLEIQGLRATAPVIQGSFARGSGEQPLELTRLLADCPVTESPTPEAATPIELECLENDIVAPPLVDGPVRGGTGVLQAQSDCPFRAFVSQRLQADDLTPPRPGLDAHDRGSLLHQALEQLWHELPDQAALLALNPDALNARIRSAVDAALDTWTRRNRLGLSKAGQALEAQCLETAMAEWLALEKQREPFRVDQLEAPITLEFNGLELSGKIDRIDRLDEGGAILIDYKTGQSGKNGWVPDERLADVQLPAYAVSLDPAPAALVFARIRPEKMSFDGLAEVDPGMSGVEVIGSIRRQPFREIESWPGLIGNWRAALQGLADDFRHGKAEVDPRASTVCRYCHLHSLCRINERVGVTEIEGDGS